MVGHLHLQAMGDTREQSRDGLLDSPDSGLPPSPSPSPPFYALSPGTLEARATTEPPGPNEAPAATSLFQSPPAQEMRPRLLPVFFGESIKVDPEPAHEIRCNSEVTYASERYFRDKIFYAPVPTVTAYSETIVAAPNCTWRSYRSQLTLEPRPRALRFGSTAIIFPKLARSSFRTTLHCSLGQPRHWFSSSLQLQWCGEAAPSSHRVWERSWKDGQMDGGSAWNLGPVVWTSEHEAASGSLSPPQAGLTVPQLQPGGV